MDFLDAISTDLPAPRDDEPAGLRQDILDELADHLACSYHRELLRGANPGEARRRAIERFGNPAAVARRLWLDAMKGTIMAQRVLIGTCLVVMAACAGVVGLVWSQSNRAAAEVAEANRRLVEVLGQTQATNQEMLKQLQAMAKASGSAKPGEWVPVKFKLTMEKPDGPPAVGYRVTLGRGLGGTTKGGMMLRLTDATGQADFGVVQPGDWEFHLEGFPWGATASFNVLPDTPVVRSVVCPIQGTAPVRVRVAWPKPLRGKNLRAVALFRPSDVTYEPPLTWVPEQARDLEFLCGPSDEAMIADPIVQLASLTSIAHQPGVDPIAKGLIHGYLRSQSSTSGEAPLDVPVGHYELDRLMLFRPLELQSFGREVFVLLSVMDPKGRDETPNGFGGLNGPESSPGPFKVRAIRFPPSYAKGLGRFEARPGQTAEWQIPLPEEMIKAAEKFSEKTIEEFKERLTGGNQVPQ
jgi:hypothetical protein